MRRPRGVHFGEMLLDHLNDWRTLGIKASVEFNTRGWTRRVSQFCYETLGGYTVRAVEPHVANPAGMFGVKWEMTR